MEEIRVGVIGLGQRGDGLAFRFLPKMEHVRVAAVCDIYEDRVASTANSLVEQGFPRPYETTDYRTLTREHIDCAVVVTSWKAHVEVVLHCMEQGIPVASEVGGARSVEECWQLVDAYERTGTPYMFMENCNYGRWELMALNMVRRGLLGQVVHCSGCYGHDLRKEITDGVEKRHYRLEEYLTRNCENYPSHELGPIMQVLDINRTNRMVKLSSFSSKAAGLHEYCLANRPEDEELCKAEFAQGDIVTTVITCQGGQTITLTLDTTLPRYYSRDFTVRGTKGLYSGANNSVFLDGVHEAEGGWREHWNNAEEYAREYEHPLWAAITEEERAAGHGGMDYLCYREFFRCVRTGEPMPIDVYDAAAMMSITPLSEQSIAAGGMPMDIPDFKGKAGERP